MAAPPDAWITLNQTGRLLDRAALETLPPVEPPPSWLADRLRDALLSAGDTRSLATRSPAAGVGQGEAFGALLDLILEVACRLTSGWRKGPAVTARDAVTLLEGTSLKPRRVLELGGQVVLAVFVSNAPRVGLHKGRRDVTRAVEYLRRRGVPLGFITNGREWRLVFADADNVAWVEWAADQFFDGEAFTPAFALLRRVLSPTALTPPAKASDEHTTSPLLAAIRQTRRGQARLSKELGEQVRKAVELLLASRQPVLEGGWDPDESKFVYNAGCRFVMRIVVVLFAEARELLPIDSPVYYHAYGLRGLRETLERTDAQHRASRHGAWPRLLALFRLLHQGSPHPQVSVPTYGGDLFRAGNRAGNALERALARIEDASAPPSDDVIYRVLTRLTRTTERVRDGTTTRLVAAPVDFTELTSEYLGILYEGLLDYELHRADVEPVVFLRIGDQPALPLDRLEAMSDKQLQALVEKAKLKPAPSSEDREASEDEDAEPKGGDGDGDGEPDGGEGEAGHADDVDSPAGELDDASLAARRRAHAWGERAAVVAKLVRAPRGKQGANHAAYRAEVEAAAKQLIEHVRLPGELYLVRWGGTRKGAGTFYTRPQLTLPTVRRTLEPLLRNPDGTSRTPEQILSLKVCDPAMGSGSFLVAALRVLTEAVVRAFFEHGRLVRQEGTELVRIDCELLPEADRDQSEDRLEAIVRRAVVEHCLYGVDLDPLAVELARVSLWIETLDRRLPFTFLDHKLCCGDALIGTWMDRFRDYPLLAWWRQSPDEKWRGVTHEGDVWANVLKEKRRLVVAEQVELLTQQQNWLSTGLSDDELETAIEDVRKLYRRLRKVPATQPDKRAEIWRTRVAPHPALARVREAFDTWCALWFWPLDRLDDAPSPATFLAPGALAKELVAELREARRFLHWELAFPDVFTQRDAGFDAIVGNPPWETQKPKSQEFFANHDPLFRGYGKQEALTRQRELFASNPGIEEDWLRYVGYFKDAGNFVRNVAEPFGDQEDEDGRNRVPLAARNPEASRRLHQQWAHRRARQPVHSDPTHPFRHQGSADLNTYKLFAEVAYRLLRPGGRLGLVIPGALLSDHGSRGLRELLILQSDVDLAYVFQNERKVFKDIHHAAKQMILVAGRPDGANAATKQEVPFVFRLGIGDSPEAEEVPNDFQRATPITIQADTLARFSPRSLSVLEIRSSRDLEVLTRIHENAVLLGDGTPDGWAITYASEFHMTNDSKLFVPRDKAEEVGYRPDEHGRWIGPEGEVLLPLYEGRMIGQFDFSKKGWVSGKGRTAVWRDIPWENKTIEPQFTLRRVSFAEHSSATARKPRVAYMDVTAATNTRTMIAAALPPLPCGNSAPILTTAQDPAVLAVILNSYAYDFVARARCGGLHLNYFVIEETPLPSPASSAQVARIGHALLGSPLLASLALSTTLDPPRFAITDHERLRLRSIADAIVAALYGLTLDDLRWILRDCDHPRLRLADKAFCRTLDPKGFWRVNRDQDPELRHSVLTVVAFGALVELIAQYGGDRDAGIAAFQALNDGEGWMLPETLRLADHGLGRDERAEAPQPIVSRLEPRLLPWQLAQTSEERRAECERHARAILGDEEFDRRFAKPKVVEVEVEERISAGPGVSAPLTATHSSAQLTLFGPSPTVTAVPTEPLAMTISQIRLLNFRNWAEEHWQPGVALKPITLMLGRNSAGKTSILQPLRMLKQTIEATDAGTHLLLNASAADGANLGAFTDVVNDHDPKRELGVGLDLEGKGISVDVRFRQVDERLVIEALSYRLRDEKIDVTRTPSAYQLASPLFRLPNWDGARDVHEAKKAYEPGRAVEFSEAALSDLGPTLGPQVRAAMVTVKEAFKSFHYLGPLRPPPAREVTWSQQDPTRLGSTGSETVQALISNETGRNKGSLRQAVSEWLKKLDLADGIEISRIGKTFLYQVEVLRGDNRSNLTDVGYGVSQVLPVIVLLHFVPEGSVILCEDPEAHLHPMAQAGLADLFVEVARQRKLQILLETHSEHLFRRLQYLIAARVARADECALYYVERDEPAAKITALESDEFGRVRNWPEHLFGDALGEAGRQMRAMVARLQSADAPTLQDKGR